MHLALEEVVLNTKLLKDLAKLTEVYHSMMLKYCSKREHFSYRGMGARTQLAALYNNANTVRNQAQTEQTVVRAVPIQSYSKAGGTVEKQCQYRGEVR